MLSRVPSYTGRRLARLAARRSKQRLAAETDRDPLDLGPRRHQVRRRQVRELERPGGDARLDSSTAPARWLVSTRSASLSAL